MMLPDKTTALIIKACAVLALVAVVWLHGHNKGADKWEGKYDTEVAAHKATKQGHATVLADLAAKTKAVATAVKAANAQYKTDRATNDATHKEDLAHAKSNRAATVRALRAGTLQLQDHRTGYQPFGAPGAAFTAAGGQDGYADLRFQAAAEDVQDADDADAWIGWLQRELIATRTAVIRAGCAVEAQP